MDTCQVAVAMGKIKNRDEKRKAAKVFTAGGGGGTKGPSVIDKRNQELKCPHCERIFKQTGRLNDHIKRQHAEAEITAGADKETPMGESNKTSENVQSKVDVVGPRIMDIGSKSGAYDYKSPKLILHEMRQRDKLPKARYKGIFDDVREVWRCKVVLPDAKRSENDIVLFLDAKDACISEQEAQQRAAVLALHRVAGNRALERTLPPSFIPLWKSLHEKEKERQVKIQKDEERRKREREIKARALKKQGPSSVIMTEGHRKMVEEILQDVKGSLADSDVSTGYENSNHSMDDLIMELSSLGFEESDARMASLRCKSLSDALDWLCLNVPEEKLPADFAAGAAGKPVTVIRSVVQAEESSEDLDPALRQLIKYGYKKDASVSALENNKGDYTRASIDLFLSLCKKLGHQDIWGSATMDSYLPDRPIVSDTLEEELMALHAIFGDVVHINDNRTIIHLSFNALVDDGIVSMLKGFGMDIDQDIATTDGIEIKSKFIFPAGDLYPNTPPVCIFTCDSLPPECMHTLTEMVVQRISECVGQALVYEVVSFIMENICSCIEKFLESSRDFKETFVVDDIALVDNADKTQGASRPTKARPKTSRSMTLTPSEVISENERLKSWQTKLDTAAECEKMLKQRQSLPAATKRSDVMQAVKQNRVTIIMGSTGCGKSTQIPQYILEDAISMDRGGRCNIICTQPRRISAIGLATRVSQERHESVGSTIGYSVRLDSKQSKNTRLLFCTTGVMLRRLLADPELKTVTHVVLDEVHERTIESDLLLFLLRELIMNGMNKTIKIILMSATAEAQLFAGYFENAKVLPPVISIPGFTHPVKDFFLEDAIEATGYQIGKSSKWAKKGSSKNEDERIGLGPNYSESTERTMSIIDGNAINVDLIEALVLHVLLKSRQISEKKNSLGAILIFVPGAMLINKLVKSLQTSHAISSHDFKIKALPLHGGLPPAEQSKVFARPPPGITKIVVATNVAETSITIDDVTCVIDTGKANEVRFDATRGISRLQEVFVSQASCQQRRGRAGRVQPGVCYKLFSKKTWESLDRNTLPEISKSALHSLVMDTKSIASGDIYNTLQRMLTPPSMDGLRRAVTSLERMGVLDAGTQHLTPLGKHLVQMPCDPKLGKMLIYSAILRCVDPVLTIAAAQAFGKPVFWSSSDSREEAAAAKNKLVGSTSSSKSDHIAIIAAYNGWRRVLAASGRRAASSYCSEYFLSDQAMDSIHSGRRQYAEILSSLGFIPDSYPNIACRAEYTSPSLTQKDDEPSIFSSRGQVDEYSGHARVVKAALASGFYPQLLRVQNPAAQFQKVHGGAIETEGSGAKVKIFDRERGRVFIHPSSINFTTGKFESGWLVFSDMMETSKIFIRECSMVPVYAVLLFGGNITVQHEKGMLIVDDWASFKSPARIGVLVRELRVELARLLERKIEDPALEISKSKLIDAMHHLLSTDGF